MVIKEESGLKFGFPEKSMVIKFDDTLFYRNYFNKFPGSKGVDFVSVSSNMIAFIEVKNCSGDEGNCRWRIAPDNKKKETASTTLDLAGRDSLDIEVTQKVAMTIASMIGAKSFGDKKDCLSEFDKFIQFLSSESFSDDSKKKYVILFLEGDFGSKTRSKKMIMQSLQDSMNRKLRWFNCRVSVVDSDSYDPKVFQITS
jgi:hypothetical protein